MYNMWVGIFPARIFGLVAQLGERTVRIRKVEGSIPFESTKKVPVFIKNRYFSLFMGQFCRVEFRLFFLDHT